MQSTQFIVPSVFTLRFFRRCLTVLLVFAIALAICGLAVAADEKSAKKDKDQEIPPPEDLSLTTTDGLELAVTYYPGTKGKQTIPVVLLHMLKQNRNDYKDLAPSLQALGYAVIVPDLRGHGESKRLKGARKDETLKASTMPPAQFGLMVTRDMDAIKKFIWEKNNAGEMNIDKLCIVGAEMGASVALNFTVADAIEQDQNPVARADYKLGRFVKALVLISPELSFRGLAVRANKGNVIPDVAMLIIVGKQDKKALNDATRIHGIFERFHPEPEGDTAAEKNDKRTLFFVKLDTSLQGTKLLDPKFSVGAMIADFLNRRLTKSEESRDWKWKDRKIPHED